MSKRGFVPADIHEFNEESLIILKKAQSDLLYLLEQGYPIKSASTFVGNHYMLSERQRLAIVRATATRDVISERRLKLCEHIPEGKVVLLDGLNLIITLEVALSYSTLIRCMDGTIRDLAGLRGTYRLIDKTDGAILLIGNMLRKMMIGQACFYLDSPVSNTGRLKMRILELLKDFPYEVTVELVHNADAILNKKKYVITGDSIVLNRCNSWINLVAQIIDEELPELNIVDFGIDD
ncbi:DUF434 domain-containing protein [Mobilitalea sibirica]|uniref:DUF434 domain-containing protein n=1 Tax=Mobilitalea sibirica TaxID=1462919 RepID=A0A8J7HDY0_9FIRM|nr:DUF434 domain-containing protein [Mobilitalea sibirica]MBH1941344.1 DUF434 domain-containing protein [Mobilitalea sibirica]